MPRTAPACLVGLCKGFGFIFEVKSSHPEFLAGDDSKVYTGRSLGSQVRGLEAVDLNQAAVAISERPGGLPRLGREDGEQGGFGSGIHINYTWWLTAAGMMPLARN